MEHHFKADLNGWLEYESKRPTMHTKIFKHRKLSIDDYDSVPTELLESFASTLTYYDYSLDARKALHATVFHAVMNNKNYATDFDIPRFETGVDHRILHHVSSRFDLHAYTIRALGRMSTQDALEFIDTTFKQTMKPLRYFHTTFVRLMHREAPLDLDYTRFNGWLAFQFQIDHDIQHHLESVIEVIYECILNNETKARQDPSIQFKTSASTNRLYDMMERLMDAISSKECFSDTTVNYIALISQWAGKPSRLCRIDSTCVPVKTCQDVRKRQSSIQHTYHALSKHRDTLDCHQQAFLAICHHLHQATGSIVNVSNQTSDFVPLQKVILAEISQVTQQVYGSYLEWKLVCCQAIDKRTRGWLSFLKLMVQFADLWLVDLERSGCMHVFVSLVVQYHLMPVLVDKVSASNKGIKVSTTDKQWYDTLIST
ncbi:uncharacterized protein B0P05DRAFT_534777 [Gilbertella persicaria]|uniref:uncharacterized protein n=1 Tax=Gilbertella persicaria TaxID=101096 RepID=UPI00221E54FC|nr:uncharacterized protein B0P05DRAFT_534777 [Gilbertella persicaria]KAI8084242.1 hypothetical protein B0P05DRAFT_534777 [Gilbertella persicaria]